MNPPGVPRPTATESGLLSTLFRTILMSNVVLVTGCSVGGIGFALCEEFAAQGCRVYATARKLESMTTLVHPDIQKHVLDVSDEENVKLVVQTIIDKEGRIDIVVNNAGLAAFGPLLDQSPDMVQRCFDTNVFAILRVSRVVLPFMAQRKTGLLVNIGSIAGEIPTPWNGLYSASKAAVAAISEVLEMECRPFNISVLHVSPGGVKSNIANTGLASMILPESSLYKEYLPDIMRRANASQTGSSLSNESFAKQVVAKALKSDPPRYMTLGSNSFVFSIFKWLPRVWVLRFLWRMYSKKQ